MANSMITELFDLTGRAALVTGAGKGIGRGIALRLAEAGASVMASDIDPDAAEETAALIARAGGQAHARRTDSADPDDIRRVTDATVERFGGLDILVNNAGIFPMAPVMDVSRDLWDRVIGLNLTGAFHHAQEAARCMIAGGRGGRIVNIASIDAFHPTGYLVHYDASKGGMVMMTKSLALELARHKITVNAVAPGAIATPGATAPDITSEQLAAFVARIPVGRQGTPEDIANAVLFLTSKASDYVTGATLVVDGGYLLS